MKVTAMTKLKDYFSELHAILLKQEYKLIELHGKDSHLNNFSENGYTKAISSDFIRIYESKTNGNNTFSFAFNNFEKTPSGVIVSIKEGIPAKMSFLTFDEFKAGLKVLNKELKQSTDCSYEHLKTLLIDIFKVGPNRLDLKDFITDLNQSLQVEAERFVFNQNKIKTLKNELAILKKKNDTVVCKPVHEDIQNKIDTTLSEQKNVVNSYKEKVKLAKDKLINEKPYISERLLSRLAAEHINGLKENLVLKDVLNQELGTCQVGLHLGEKYSD